MLAQRLNRTALAAIMIAMALGLGSVRPSPALADWQWARHCVKKADLDVLQPLIQQMLKHAAVGSRQPWCSATGRQGFVHLVAGGELAGATTATIRITLAKTGGEKSWLVFLYRKDPVRGWGVVG